MLKCCWHLNLLFSFRTCSMGILGCGRTHQANISVNSHKKHNKKMRWDEIRRREIICVDVDEMMILMIWYTLQNECPQLSVIGSTKISKHTQQVQSSRCTPEDADMCNSGKMREKKKKVFFKFFLFYF